MDSMGRDILIVNQVALDGTAVHDDAVSEPVGEAKQGALAGVDECPVGALAGKHYRRAVEPRRGHGEDICRHIETVYQTDAMLAQIPAHAARGGEYNRALEGVDGEADDRYA